MSPEPPPLVDSPRQRVDDGHLLPDAQPCASPESQLSDQMERRDASGAGPSSSRWHHRWHGPRVASVSAIVVVVTLLSALGLFGGHAGFRHVEALQGGISKSHMIGAGETPLQRREMPSNTRGMPSGTNETPSVLREILFGAEVAHLGRKETPQGTNGTPSGSKQTPLTAGEVLVRKEQASPKTEESLSRERQAPSGSGPGPSFLEQARGPCGSPLRSRLHQHLHKIVLIINNNFDDTARNTTAFLRSVYSGIFDTIVFLGPTDVPEVDVQARARYGFAKNWYGAYVALERIIPEHPEAEGFLWVNEDVALNYWNMLKADKKKIWMPQRIGMPHYPFNLSAPAKFDDYPSERAHRVAAWTAYQSMAPKYRNQFGQSMLPLIWEFPKSSADVLYIPQEHALRLAKDLVPVFRRVGLYSELALPMMLLALEHPRNFDPVLDSMVIRWEDRMKSNECFDPVLYWMPNMSALHPWKLSQKVMRQKYLNTLGQEDPCLLTLPLVV